jgi:AcrR family transcriptional regulator
MSRRRGASRGEDRARLIGAAAACYGRGGRGAMTLSQVCAQADASVGTVYHHFPGGLRDIEDALYLDTLRGYQQGLLAELRRHRSAVAGVKSVVTYHLDWVASNTALAQYLLSFSGSWLSSEHVAQLELMNLEFARAAEDWREPHVAAGRIRRLSSMLYGSLVLGPAQQYGGEMMAKADIEDVAAAIREAAPALAEAAWAAVKGKDG